MKRLIAFFFITSLALFLTGCPDEPGLPTPPPPVPLDPQYVACMSLTPVDAGSPNEPVITPIGPRVVSQPLGKAYVDAGATASDPHDGDITSHIVVSGLDSLDVNTVGDYLIRYNVADSAQLPAVEVVRMVRVNDAGKFMEQTARDFGSTGAHLPYYEHLPVDYSNDPAQKFPLIVFQHGWGGARFTPDGTAVQLPLGNPVGDMAGLIASGLWDDSRPFIVLSPQRCIDPDLDDFDAPATKLFIDYAINTYKIDISRIYLAGYSAGSCLTWDYVVHYPNQLAAVVPLSGSGGTTYGCTLKLTPSWAFEAADDPAGPYMNQVETVESINACNPTERAKITVFPSGGHNQTEEFFTINLTGLGQGLPAYDIYDENIYDWLLAHSRLTATPSAISLGRSATLNWSVKGAGSCVASGDWAGPRQAGGAESVTPDTAGLHLYVLACTGSGGPVMQSAELTVKAPEEPAPADPPVEVR